MTTPGEIIAVLIKERQFKQGEFADKIGIARSSLNRIIKGTKPLGKINQKRIAEGLELSLSKFLFLINLGAPLETYHFLLAVADLRDNTALAIVDKITTVADLIAKGKLPPETLNSILHQLEVTIKIANHSIN